MDDPTQTIDPAPRRVARRGVVGVIPIHSEVDAVRPVATAVRRAMRIGRDDDAEITIADPGVSRAHAELTPDRGALRVRDLSSRNGTFVDGRAIEGEVRAAPGAILRVGNTLLHVCADTEAFTHHPLGGGEPLVGGPSLAAVRAAIAQLAPSRAPVLVEGESGTGKEVVAAAIHAASGRSGGLVAVNCAAVAPQLLESELFGHARGAFSGSEGAREGLFRSADGGTLLLDEIGELPLEAQAKLLRVLEASEVRPVGEDRPRRIDVRVIGATNRDLWAMVEAGRFRADLYHRVAADRLSLPPLRERREDIPALARRLSPPGAPPLSTDAVAELLARPLPGNVRELKNLVVAAAARASAEGAERIAPAHLPEGRGASPPMADGTDADAALRVRLETALELYGGNVSRVARELGLRRAGLYDLFRRFDLDPARYRAG